MAGKCGKCDAKKIHKNKFYLYRRKYKEYRSEILKLDDFFVPFENVSQENINNVIYQNFVNNNFDVMIDTDNNLNSPFVNSSKSIESKKYLFERYCVNNINNNTK